MKNRLRVLRAENEWSQADLATRLEVSRQTVNALETGKYDPSLPLAFKLAIAPEHQPMLKAYIGKEVTFGIRPEDLEAKDVHVPGSTLRAKVTVVEPLVTVSVTGSMSLSGLSATDLARASRVLAAPALSTAPI